MHILVSNDDGYLAPGLAALARACRGLGEVSVVAPENNASGTSNALSLHRPLSVSTSPQGAHIVNGTPSDCVHVALTGLLTRRPDLVVTGINNGANMGEDTLYSGTVAAATEGYLFGIRAIAFSLTEKGWRGLNEAAGLARCIIEHALAQAGDGPWLLNVNVPPRPAPGQEQPGQWRITRLGRRHASEPVLPYINPHGDAMYWIGPAGPARDAGEGTDFDAVAQGAVSITPLQVDLTDHAHLGHWRNWTARG